MILKPQRFVSDALIASAEKFPDKPAVIVEGEAYSFSQLHDHALRLASALKAKGLERGQRVAIYMDNTWPCVISIYGILLAGGAFLVINPQTKADKLSYILNDCGADILLTDAHLKPVVSEVLAGDVGISSVICSGDVDNLTEGLTSSAKVEDFFNVITQNEPVTEHHTVTPSDLACLVYTSGSTGNPKGVMHTHLSMTFAIQSLVEYQRLNHELVMLNMLPFAFDYGLYQLLMAIYVGSTLVIERSFTYPAVIFKRIKEFNINVFPGVPTIFSMIMAAHKRNALSFPSITRVTNTAAALPAEHIPVLKEIFPNALIYKMYGMTECKRVSYLEPELIDEKGKSVGKAIPGTEIYLLDNEGNEVKPGELGILHVRGPHVMLGYWNQPQLSQQMLKAGKYPGERVLCTQDWFKMDEDGFLYFVGRSDDIIKTRGEKVSPIEVENVLNSIDGIVEAAVVGVADETLGESIRAYVALDKGVEINDRQIKKVCMSCLENFMVPQQIIILDSLPKTQTGKISKKLLLEQQQ